MRLFALAALVPLTLLPLLPAPSMAPQKQVATVEEPETEVRFPVTLTVVDKDTQHELMGVGVRVKKKFFMNFNVYAMGFYVDREGALEACASRPANSARPSSRRPRSSARRSWATRSARRCGS